MFNHNPFWPEGSRNLYKGGMKAAPLPPPPTERQTEVVSAQRQARVDSRRRKGQLTSLLAGETGGAAEVQTKTLLGGSE